MAPTIPDPLQAGPHQVTRLDYDFGYFVVDDPTLVAFRYVVPLHGSCDYAGTLEFFSTAACPDADLSGATAIRILCDGDGGIQLADNLLV